MRRKEPMPEQSQPTPIEYFPHFQRVLIFLANCGLHSYGLHFSWFDQQRHRCHTEFCVTVYNKKVLNSVQPWPRSFSAMCHYTKFDMASEIDGKQMVSLTVEV